MSLAPRVWCCETFTTFFQLCRRIFIPFRQYSSDKSFNIIMFYRKIVRYVYLWKSERGIGTHVRFRWTLERHKQTHIHTDIWRFCRREMVIFAWHFIQHSSVEYWILFLDKSFVFAHTKRKINKGCFFFHEVFENGQTKSNESADLMRRVCVPRCYIACAQLFVKSAHIIPWSRLEEKKNHQNRSVSEWKPRDSLRTRTFEWVSVTMDWIEIHSPRVIRIW